MPKAAIALCQGDLADARLKQTDTRPFPPVENAAGRPLVRELLPAIVPIFLLVTMFAGSLTAMGVSIVIIGFAFWVSHDKQKVSLTRNVLRLLSVASFACFLFYAARIALIFLWANK